MTLNGAIMQLVELRESSMMPEALKPCFDKVIETISECEEPSAQQEQHWIPCSERLPEEGCEFLCCDERGESIIGLPYADEEAYTGFSAESETEYIFNCVAWMPLPEPYRGEGEER